MKTNTVHSEMVLGMIQKAIGSHTVENHDEVLTILKEMYATVKDPESIWVKPLDFNKKN